MKRNSHASSLTSRGEPTIYQKYLSQKNLSGAKPESRIAHSPRVAMFEGNRNESLVKSKTGIMEPRSLRRPNS